MSVNTRIFLVMLLGATTALPVQAAEPALPRRVEKFTPADSAKSRAAERSPRRRATIAVFVTDDADSMRLPAFATPTTPLPVRFMRVGVEWTF